MRDEGIWVEPVGSVIVARLRGIPTAEMLRECEQRVLELARDMRQVRVLYDALELVAPEIELVLLQQQLDLDKKGNLNAASLRTAILVPNTRIAYLSRIAFGHAGEANYRVFYNDFSAALKWLEERGSIVPVDVKGQDATEARKIAEPGKTPVLAAIADGQFEPDKVSA